jgi:hypothetical protein
MKVKICLISRYNVYSKHFAGNLTCYKQYSHGSSYRLVVKPVRSERKFNWLHNYSQNSPVSSFRKIRPAVREFFHAYGRKDGAIE